jgi:uncharacterized protein
MAGRVKAKRFRWRRFGLGAAIGAVLCAIVFHPILHALGGASAREPSEFATRASPAAQSLVDAALRDLDPQRRFDFHVHVAGMGDGGTGCRVNPKMLTWSSPKRHVQFLVYCDAARIRDVNHGDAQYVERLRDLVRGEPRPGRFGLLAFDGHWNEDGTLDEAGTEMFTPNERVIELAREDPDIFVPILSIHPYRKDAVAELERFAQSGAKIVKWLPNAMGIDPASPRCDAFYAAMARLKLVLLSHGGEEHAVDAKGAQALGNPLRLRRALDHGVKVIVAHCASTGLNEDLDDPARKLAENFDLFLRLMDEPRYRGLVFGEISAITQRNRCERPLRTLLDRTDLHERLVDGSDYPLPAINVLFSTQKLVEQGYITEAERAALNEIYDYNPLLFDLATKRALKSPSTGTKFPASVFMTRPELGL